jgi:hypothetical protein
VSHGLLGRTNREFPSVWLSLSPPRHREDLADLVSAALEAKVPIDITSSPGLWGGQMRGTDAFLTCISSFDYEHANDERHAADLVQAHLIETLSCIGREHFDIYFLRIRRAVEEYQISGALEALEAARQEGHIRYIGLCCDGPSLAILGAWQFHDAFDVILTPRNHLDEEAYHTLAPLAKERRVGVITSRPLNWGFGLPFVKFPSQWRLRNLTQSFYGLSLAEAVIADLAVDHPVLVGVRSAEEVLKAIAAPAKQRPTGLRAFLAPYCEAWNSEEEWVALKGSEDAELKAAFERRRKTFEF